MKTKARFHRFFFASVLSLLLMGCGLFGLLPGEQTPIAAAPMAAAPDLPDGSGTRWQPPPRFSWQWQLTGEFDASIAAEVYDLDLFESDARQIAALRAAGKHTICYLSAGSFEDWRPDAGQFPASVLGINYEGWPGERWLDIRRIDQLAGVLTARLDLCKHKGFDAVEPDNIDGYTNETGFALTPADQLAFNRWLAAEAHARGLSIGLKNDPDQAAELADDFDWALTEDCFVEGWCAEMLPFAQRGKPVLMAEYTDTGVELAALCAEASRLGYNAILKDRELDAAIEICE